MVAPVVDLVVAVVEVAELAPLVFARAAVAVSAHSPSAHDDPPNSALSAYLDSVLPTASAWASPATPETSLDLASLFPSL